MKNTLSRSIMPGCMAVRFPSCHSWKQGVLRNQFRLEATETGTETSFGTIRKNVCFGCFASIPKQRVSIEPKHTEDPPKQFKREYIWVFFRQCRVVSVCYETVLFVSVVSISVRNTKTNRFFLTFGLTKQTETNAKQILFRFVSVRTEIYFYLFLGHPRRTY